MTATSPQRRWPIYVAIGCAVLLVCVSAAAAFGAYSYIRAHRGTAAEPTIEYILDASPRMETPSTSGDTRIGVARGVLAEIVRTADTRLTAGLRVFGTGALPEGCQDTDLVVPFALANQGKIEGSLGGIETGAESDSPFAQAMIAAIKDMASTDGPHSIVAVTGGSDSCNPEAGELIRQEAERAGIELNVFVVGFEVPPDDVEAIKALVDLIPGATYLDAPDPPALRKALTQIQTDVNRETAAAIGDVVSVPSPSARANACDHPYLPLRSGATWSYDSPEGAFTWSVSGAGGSADSASATMDFSFPGGTTTVHWGCGPEGITSHDFRSLSAVSYDFANMKYNAFAFDGTTERVDSSGTWLPAADSMVPGYSWSNDYTMIIRGSKEGVSFEYTSPTSESWTVAGIESVAVPAGTFDALRIDGTGTWTTTLCCDPAGRPGYLPGTSNESIWLVEGVGIVRNTYHRCDDPDCDLEIELTIELMGYSVP